jgi:hypothetical protein
VIETTTPSSASSRIGAALASNTVHRLVLYEPAPGVQALADEDIERIEELVARNEREEALVRAFRLFGLTPEELEQISVAPSWPERVAAVHTVAREIQAEEAFRVEPSASAR